MALINDNVVSYAPCSVGEMKDDEMQVFILFEFSRNNDSSVCVF